MLIMHPLLRVNEFHLRLTAIPVPYNFKQAQFGVYVRMALIPMLLGLVPKTFKFTVDVRLLINLILLIYRKA